jgi:hypothetical protein
MATWAVRHRLLPPDITETPNSVEGESAPGRGR